MRRLTTPLALLALPGLAAGQYPQYPVVVRPYVAPAYHVPVVYREKVIVKVKEIPFAVPVPFALFSFVAPPTTPPPVLVAAPPPPPPAPAPAAAAPEVEARLARIEAALSRLAEARVGVPPGDGPPVAVAASGDVAAAAAQARAAPPPPKPPAAVRTDYPGDLGPAVAALAARGCAACHTGKASRPAYDPVTLWDDSGAWNPNREWSEIHAAVRPRKGPRGEDFPARMPKGAPAKMSPAEVALVKRMTPSGGKSRGD